MMQPPAISQRVLPLSTKMVLDGLASRAFSVLPGALKWTALLVLALNVRSFPLAWHRASRPRGCMRTP
jgi:hypothetical protein